MKWTLKKMRIRHQILMLSLFIIILSSTTTLMSFIYISSELKAQTLKQSTDAMADSINEMDRFFREFDMTAFVTCSNADLQTFITQNQNLSMYNYTQQYNTVTQLIGQISIPRDYIQVHVFSQTMQRPIIAQFGTRWLNESYRFEEDDWYVQLEGQNEANRVILPNGTQNYYAPTERSDVVTCAYRVLSRPLLDTIGYLVIDINKAYLDHYFVKDVSDKADIYLCLSDYTPVYSTVKDEPADPDQLRGIHEQISRTGNQIIRIDNVDYLAATGYSSVTGWMYISLISLENQLAEFRLISFVFLLWFAMTTIIGVGLSFGMARNITYPLERLISQMKQAKRGHVPLSINMQTYFESADLMHNFNDMMVEINDLMGRNAKMAVLHKEAELNALQKQINPHFIYNTLEIMIGAACEGNNEAVISVCKSLGRMLSYNLDSSRHVTLGDEINHVANYIRITETIMSGRFEAVIDVDQSLYGYLLPRFIIQPIVENSIIHGFADTLEGGYLYIGVRPAAHQLQLIVRDNGCGMDERTRLRLLDVDADGDGSASGGMQIGVTNVFKRLKLHFGAETSFFIKSTPGEGTEVTMIIPKVNPLDNPESGAARTAASGSIESV